MVAQALLGGGGPGDGGEVLGHSPLKSAPRALGLAAGESGQGRRNNGTGFLGYSGRISPPDGVARLPCIWKENCSDQFISVDSKGSVAQCDCWVTSYPKYFFGNILREPGLTRMLKTSPARRDFVERLPQREALLDALAYGCHEWI